MESWKNKKSNEYRSVVIGSANLSVEFLAWDLGLSNEQVEWILKDANITPKYDSSFKLKED